MLLRPGISKRSQFPRQKISRGVHISRLAARYEYQKAEEAQFHHLQLLDFPYLSLRKLHRLPNLLSRLR